MGSGTRSPSWRPAPFLFLLPAAAVPLRCAHGRVLVRQGALTTFNEGVRLGFPPSARDLEWTALLIHSATPIWNESRELSSGVGSVRDHAREIGKTLGSYLASMPEYMDMCWMPDQQTLRLRLGFPTALSVALLAEVRARLS